MDDESQPPKKSEDKSEDKGKDNQGQQKKSYGMTFEAKPDDAQKKQFNPAVSVVTNDAVFMNQSFQS